MACLRSWLVAAITRTSTTMEALSPTRRTSCSSMTRNSSAWNVGGSHPDQAGEELAHRGGAPDQIVELVPLAELVGEESDVDDQAAPLQRALHAHQELALLEGLVHVVAGAHLHRLDGAFDGAVA